MKIVILTGAGISAESGLKTFRDSGGLWEGHDVTQVATPEAWDRNKAMVLKFYNERRRQLKEVSPNPAHLALAQLENKHETLVITQNVDDLHERAGTTNIIHLHGELNKVRSSRDHSLVYSWSGDLNEGDNCEEGFQLRPHIVWFGEAVPMLDKAIHHMLDADVAIIVGTSMQVYPAASLIGYAPQSCEIYYVDPNPTISYELRISNNLNTIPEKATTGVPPLVERLLTRP